MMKFEFSIVDLVYMCNTTKIRDQKCPGQKKTFFGQFVWNTPVALIGKHSLHRIGS